MGIFNQANRWTVHEQTCLNRSENQSPPFLIRSKQLSTRADSWIQNLNHCQRLLGLQHFHLIFCSSMCLPNGRLSLHSWTHGESQPGYLPHGLFCPPAPSTYLPQLPAPWQGPGLIGHTLPPRSSSHRTWVHHSVFVVGHFSDLAGENQNQVRWWNLRYAEAVHSLQLLHYWPPTLTLKLRANFSLRHYKILPKFLKVLKPYQFTGHNENPC